MALFLSSRFVGLALSAVLILALLPAAQAQVPARVATRVDSLRAARYGVAMYVPAVFTFSTGKQVKGFLATHLGLPTYFLNQVDCYETSPEQIPPPPIKTISIARLKQMTIEGHHYEALYLKNKPLGLLAENLAGPGAVELFGYAKTKNDMLVPIPLPVGALVLSTGTHDKYYWYVRTQGSPLLEVPRGDKEFAKVMGAFFGDNAPLAARIRQQERGAGFHDMVALARQFNAAAAEKY